MDKNIRIEDAVVHFRVKDGTVKAVDHVTAAFRAGEITGLIGESGCGKSVLGMAILGLLPEYAQVEGGIWLEGKNLLAQSPKQMRRLRGRGLGLIPQNPADSFNPVRRIRGQIQEGLRVGKKKPRGRRIYWKRLGLRRRTPPAWQAPIPSSSAAACCSGPRRRWERRRSRNGFWRMSRPKGWTARCAASSIRRFCW